MVKFNTALKWMEEGKKVRRPKWKEASYWAFGQDQGITFKGIRIAHVHLNQIIAEDWEIYKDKNLEKKSFYKCGHNRKNLFLDMEDAFVMVNYFIWKDSEGFKGNRKKCFGCYFRDLKEEIKKKKQEDNKEIRK